MFDQTARVGGASPAQETVPEQLRQLMQRIADVIDLLRARQNTLRGLGMNLPLGSLDTIRRVRSRLDTLATQQTDTQSELHQLRGLAETTALINSSLETSEVLNQVIDKVIELTGAERGYIVLKNPDTGELEFRVARGLDREQLAADEFIVSNTVVNRVASSGEPVLTHNAVDDPRYQGQDSIVGFALRSILAVPLRVNDDVIGVVYCDNRIRAGLFKDHELHLLTAFGHQAAVAIQNARLFEALRARLAEIIEMRDLMDNIFTSIASGLIALDEHNVITAFNAAAERMTGVLSAEALGCSLARVLPLGDEFASAVEQARAIPVEIDVTLEAPNWRYWKIKMNPLRDAEGVALVLDDLTDEKQREAQLDAAIRYMPVPLENIHSLNLSDMGGQMREISVVFADVRGFTSFSERLEPETLMQIINHYLGRASDAVDLFEGVVDKYMGDAATGLFNTQLNPQPDHAIRAVRAALRMTDDIAELHQYLPPEQRLFYGIGVHTGLAVLGSVGGPERREFSAIGDALDLSKLLQENAQRGEILLSEATYRQVADVFEAEALAPRTTHGRADFSVMYRLVGERGA